MFIWSSVFQTRAYFGDVFSDLGMHAWPVKPLLSGQKLDQLPNGPCCFVVLLRLKDDTLLVIQAGPNLLSDVSIFQLW